MKTLPLLKSAGGSGLRGLIVCGMITFWQIGTVGETVEAGAAGASLSSLRALASPSDADIFNTRVFDEPIIPINGATRARENQALAKALYDFANRRSTDDFSSLTDFLEAFPRSAWRTSLLLHLGTEYYNHGHYSRALSVWETGWRESRAISGGPGKPQVDRIAGELARMYSKVGRITELSRLLEDVKEANLQGPATQLIDAARGALWMMQTKPDFCFKCGPLALERILRWHKPSRTGQAAMIDANSGTNGFSLKQVAALSRAIEMNYQMAYRSAGAALIVPAVVHWRIGHYAAVVDREAGRGRLLVQDDTFSSSVWLTPAAIEAEGSGYFLVPAGALPEGWRSVSEQEADAIWGKGYVDGQYPGATTPFDTRTRTCADPSLSWGMAAYNFHALLASLIVDDTPVGYAPPVGPPVRFAASYHHREANQPAVFAYSNLGAKWTCNWISYITDNPGSPNADVKLYVDGGGTLEFSGFSAAAQSYRVEVMSQALLVKLSASTYELQFADGSKKQYLRSDGAAGSTRRVFLSRLIDPAGNAVELRYDAQLRITNIVDALGQVTTLTHTNAAYPYAITGVTDPFGRSASFEYNASGLLARITDVLGMTSEFSYGSGQFLNTLTTPYGTTTFTSGTVTGGGNGSFFVQATDPEGQSERVEFYQGSGGYPHYLPNSEVPRGLATFNRFMDGRNSYYWDKKAYAEAAGDYTRAKNYHWVHYATTAAAPILETLKEPLEGRVWFNYPGQPTNWGAPYYLNSAYAGAMNKPSIMARILEDGTTQLSSFEYNPLGNLTKSIDPAGRTFSFVYDTNNVDRLEVRMTRNGRNELLQRMTYNAQHQLLTTTDSAGQTTTNAYNSRGQLVSTRNALGQTTTYAYDAKGYLTSVSGPISGVTNDLTVTHDMFGRPRTMTFAPGFTLTYDYDALDRVTRISYPDGTFEQIVYDRLDPAAFRDRLGQWTTNTYNRVGQLVQTRDPAGRVTSYSWCACGSPESITDPMGRTTTWRYDIRGRVAAKIFPDGSTVTYEYDAATGLVKAKRDERGQLTRYSYYPDNNIKEVSFRDTAVPTPSVRFTYDPDYNRVQTIQDGAGLTQRSYYPIGIVPTLGAGALQSISGPLPNSTVSYAYDELGRLVSRSIDGVAEAWAYDALDRIVTATNALGVFRYGYVDVTRRMASLAYPNGQTNLFAYYGNAGDRRLQSVSHFKPNGALLSRLGLAYDSAGRITSWTNEWDSLPGRVWEFQYDAAGQLAAALRKQGGATLAAYSYSYDPAGNRRAAALSGTTNRFDYNALNQLVSSQPVPQAPAGYEWDGAQRLTAIVSGGRRTEFSYDGFGRRVRIVEKTNGVVLSDTRYLWSGKQIHQARDASGSVVRRRFFPHGEIIHGVANTNLFYIRDHLSSVREVTDPAGTLRARFDYDPYGQSTALSAGIEPAFTFAGQFRHAGSDLNLTLYRAYDPRLGRWLSRDPLGEAVGLNLYAYVENDPVNFVDPDGDAGPIAWLVGLAIGEAISETATGQELFGGIYTIYRKLTGSWEEGKRLAELRKLFFDLLREPCKYSASGNIEPILQAVIAEIRYLDVSTAQQLSDAAAEAAGLTLPGPNQFPGPSLGPAPARF